MDRTIDYLNYLEYMYIYIQITNSAINTIVYSVRSLLLLKGLISHILKSYNVWLFMKSKENKTHVCELKIKP